MLLPQIQARVLQDPYPACNEQDGAAVDNDVPTLVMCGSVTHPGISSRDGPHDLPIDRSDIMYRDSGQVRTEDVY